MKTPEAGGGLKSAAELAMEKTVPQAPENDAVEEKGDLKTAVELAMEKTAPAAVEKKGDLKTAVELAMEKTEPNRAEQKEEILDKEEIANEGEEIRKALSLEEKNQAEMDKFFKPEDGSTAMKNYDKDGNEILDKPMTQAEKAQAEMDKFFAKGETTMAKTYDKDGNEILDKPMTQAEKAQAEQDKYFAKGETTMAKTYDKDGKEIIDAEPVAVSAEKKGVIDVKVQEGALEDFRKGLGKEKVESKWGKKMKRTWGWLKERLKGLATLGITEFHQAEKFRSGTGKAAEDLSNKAFREADANIERTGGGVVDGEDRRLTLEESEAEAAKMMEMREKETPGAEKTSAENYEKYSQAVTQEKITKNDAYIDTLVVGSEGQIKEYLAKYKNEFGENVLTDEKLGKFRAQLKDQLTDLRKGLETRNGALQGLGVDQERMKKSMRESLDPNYWRRYVYGGVEAAIDIALITTAAGYLGANSVSVSGPGMVPTHMPVPGLENLHAIKDVVPMDGSVWNTMDGVLKGMGVDPTNAELLKVTQAASQGNGVGVDLWNIAGSPMDTMMQQGHPLKMTEGVKTAIEAILHSRGM